MDTELKISSQLLRQYFDLKGEAAPRSYPDILAQLTHQVAHLLNQDFQTLINALYRIDVDEGKFVAALELSKPNEIATEIARLILDRIILKAQTRMKYQNL